MVIFMITYDYYYYVIFIVYQPALGLCDLMWSSQAARADPNRGRNDGGTALMFAAQEGHLKVAKYLELIWAASASDC